MFERSYGFKPSKRPTYNGTEKPLQYRDRHFREAPFKVFSGQVSVNYKGENVECLFPTKWGQVTFAE